MLLCMISQCVVMCCMCKVLKSLIGCGYGWCGICRELRCVYGWKNVKDIGMGVRKGTVVSFVYTFFVYFVKCCFLKCLFVNCFSYFWGRRWGSGVGIYG